MSNRGTTVMRIAATLLAAAGSAQAFVITNAPAANIRAHQDCSGVTPGGTDLVYSDGSVGYWPAGTLNGTLDALNWQFGTTTVHNGNNPDTMRAANQTWSFQWGNTLSGTLTVDWNKAFDTDYTQNGTNYCKHGSEFDCHYTRGATIAIRRW